MKKIPRKILKCKYCGKSYSVKHYRESISKYCSRKCSYADASVDSAICPICGKVFVPKPYHGKRQRFCSSNCRWTHERQNPIIETVICKRCEKPFRFAPSQHRVYCSGSCAGNIPKKENERFRRVKTKEWASIRKEILRRDGHKCQICRSKKNLNVHHITPWRKTRDDSHSNLITLCDHCHYRVEWKGLACPVPLSPPQ